MWSANHIGLHFSDLYTWKMNQSSEDLQIFFGYIQYLSEKIIAGIFLLI
jgi:hypothetical protein